MKKEYLKKIENSIREYLEKQGIKLEKNIILDLIAIAQGLKSGKELEVIMRQEFMLPVEIRPKDLELVDLLQKTLLFNVDFQHWYGQEDKFYSILPSDLNLYFEDNDRYIELLAADIEKTYRAEMMKRHPGKEEAYDFWRSSSFGYCLGKNRDGVPCKNRSSYYDRMDFSSFLEYRFHPKNFCKKHKNQVSLLDKQRIALLMRQDALAKYPCTVSLATVARKLEVSVDIVRKWYESNSWKKIDSKEV